VKGLGLAAALVVLCWPTWPAAAQPVTVPVDVGVGPAGFLLTGRVAEDQPLHFGLKISVQAIIDQATMQRYQHRIPPRLRRRALQMKEVRYSPSLLIPDALILSPAIENTGVYGIGWRPFSVGAVLADGPAARLRLAAGLLVTYAYIHSSLPEIPETHFLRPGIDLGIELELAPSQPFSVSAGWASGFYLPQALGSFAVTSSGSLSDVLWHIGQAWVKLHFRFPYTTTM
jgi:hypothetical protein